MAYNSVQDEEGDIGDHAEENTGDTNSYRQQQINSSGERNTFSGTLPLPDSHPKLFEDRLVLPTQWNCQGRPEHDVRKMLVANNLPPSQFLEPQLYETLCSSRPPPAIRLW